MPDHLCLPPGSAELAIITGDPDRVGMIGAAFDAVPVGTRRGFICHAAAAWDHPLVIVSTGIGGPSTAIVTEELVEIGVRAIIRIGTCGGLQPDVHPDELVVVTGCVRDEGTSRAYIDVAYPALANPALTQALVQAGRASRRRFHLGVTHCKDAYYAERPAKQVDPEMVGRRWQGWRNAGVLATEMEAAPLFVVANLRRIAAAAVLIVVGKGRGLGFDAALSDAVAAARGAFERFVHSGELAALPRAAAADDRSFLARNPAQVPPEASDDA